MPIMYRVYCLLVAALLFNGCTGISVRKHVLNDYPAWESKNLLSTIPTTNDQTTQMFLSPNFAQRKANATCLPGLQALVNQVLSEKEPVCFGSETLSLTTKDADHVYLVEEATPLPDILAKNPVTKAIVRAIYEEYKKLHYQRIENNKDKQQLLEVAPSLKGMDSKKLVDEQLSANDFKELAESLAAEVWAPRQLDRLKKETHPFFNEDKRSMDSKLSWFDIFTFYLMDYYSGNYVDRFGVGYDKFKLDFKISNNAVVAFINIFQDSLWDYALLGLYKDVKTPVVYKTGEPNTFYNASTKVPTFAKLLRAKHNNENTVDWLVEPERDGAAQKGLSKSEVCVIQYFSGLSGEASEALSGMIVRSIGGSNLGFVVAYGKFSIGDNQLLTKLIDASVDTFSKRSAAALFSTIFYKSTTESLFWADKAQKKDPVGSWLGAHVKLGEILECFEKK